MAYVKELNSKTWLIFPAHMGERSALLRTPSRKWMQMMGAFKLTKSPANARALRQEIDNSQITFDMTEAGIQFGLELLELTAPSRKARQFPTWYQFKNVPHPPLPHQIEALKELYPTDTPAALMEMGTCKTRVCVDLMAAHFYEQRIQAVIVICPVTVKMATWEAELARRCPCPYDYVDVGSDFRADNVRIRPDRLAWFVVGVESLSQGKTLKALFPLTQRPGFKYAIVADESTRIANTTAVCSQAAVELRKNAKIAMIMTGQEIEKSLENVYGQFEFLDPHIVGCGDFISFRNRYCQMGGYKNKKIVGYNHLDELMGLIAPHVYQCDKSVIKLPPKLYQQRRIAMHPAQREMYKKIKLGLVPGVSVANTLTKTIRLRQVASGFYNTDGWRKDPKTNKKEKIPITTVEVIPPNQNPKLNELLSIAEVRRRPMIVWVNNRYELQLVTAALQPYGSIMHLTGEVHRDDRRRVVDTFQEGKTDFMIANPAAGGIGITLTAADVNVFYSNGERLGYRVQAEDRSHRQGQENSVTIIDLIMQGTVDSSIWRNLSEKIDLAAYWKMALHDKKAMEKFYDGEIDEAILEQARMVSQESLEEMYSEEE